jgi:hypothetical protein
LSQSAGSPRNSGDLVGLAEDVRVVLRHGPHPREARQGAAALVAVQARELGEAQRQLAVGALAQPEHVAVAWAVHGLDAELLALVGAGEPEHVVVELVVMARALEQLRAQQQRGHHLLVAVLRV